MCRMLEQHHHTSQYEDQLKALFNTPPNPYSGEVPTTGSLVEAVLIESTLMDLPKSMPYHVPAHYNQQPFSIPQNEPSTLRVSWVKYLQAACIILFISLSFFPFYQSSKVPQGISLTNPLITADDAQWYIENQTLNNDILWYEWEDKLALDESIALQTNTDMLNNLTPEEINTFF